MSADSLAAVDGDDLAGHERGRGGSEKDDRTANFVGLAHPTQRNGRHQRRLVLGVAGETIEHAGVGRPGCDGVDAHTRGSALERRGFGDAFDGVLAADIDRGTGGTLMTVGRGDVDDAAALLRRHHAQLMFQAEQHAEHIGVEGGGVALGGLIDDQAPLALGTGIVDGGVDPAEAGHGLIDQVAHLVFVTDVGLDERGFGAQAAKFGLESPAFGLPAAGDDEAGAVLGEGDGGGATYACEGSSDQNDWRWPSPGRWSARAAPYLPSFSAPRTRCVSRRMGSWARSFGLPAASFDAITSPRAATVAAESPICTRELRERSASKVSPP